MPLALLVATVVLAHTAYNGTRLNISLAALAAGASPLTVGVLMSLIAALPMLLGIFAGRLVDRVGVRLPLTTAGFVLVASIVLPGAAFAVPTFFVASVGMGTSFMVFHICAQHMVGEMSDERTRRDNFGWLALGFGVSNLAGPSMTGFAIDHIGHRATFFVLAAFAVAALAIVLLRRHQLSHTHHSERSREARSAVELLRSAELRRVFIVSGMLASAWDMYTFVMPIYGTQIGLSATTIGLILASFAAATFTVRLSLPVISRHVSEWPLITATFVIACIAYALFPFVETVLLLASISFFLGLGLGATQPSLMALLYATAPAGRAAEAVGVRTVVLNASSTLLPLVFGGLGTALGMSTVFWTMSGALAGGGVFANARRAARA